MFVFLNSLQQMAFASQNFFALVSNVSWGKWLRKGSVEGSVNYCLHLTGCCFIKKVLEGSPNCASHLSPSLIQNPQKTAHHGVAVGVSVGLVHHGHMRPEHGRYILDFLYSSRATCFLIAPIVLQCFLHIVII